MKDKDKEELEAHSNSAPLVFFYTGLEAPPYAKASLTNAVKAWNGEVVFLHNFSRPPQVQGVRFVNYEDWYDPTSFDKFRSESPLDSEFREGFWFHTAERFFVLSQWAHREEIDRFAHAELDIAFFAISGLLPALDSMGKGIFLPRAAKDYAGGSFVYTNHLPTLNELVSFLVSNAGFGHEMGILAKFLDSGSPNVYVLPSHASLLAGSQYEWSGSNKILPSEIGALVDVQPIGTWIFGQDPRNSPKQPTYNHFFFEDIGFPDLKLLTYRYSWRNRAPMAKGPDGSEWPVVILHVHFKKMELAYHPLALTFYCWLANLNRRTPIVVQRPFRFYFGVLRRQVDGLYLRLKKAKAGTY